MLCRICPCCIVLQRLRTRAWLGVLGMRWRGAVYGRLFQLFFLLSVEGGCWMLFVGSAGCISVQIREVCVWLCIWSEERIVVQPVWGSGVVCPVPAWWPVSAVWHWSVRCSELMRVFWTCCTWLGLRRYRRFWVAWDRTHDCQMR